MKKIKLTESKSSKAINMTKKPQFINKNDIKDIKSLVYRSLELDKIATFNDSSNSSDFYSDSGISGSSMSKTLNETIDISSVISNYKNSMHYAFSLSMPRIFNQSNSNCSAKPIDHNLLNIKVLGSTQNVCADFTSSSSNRLNISEITNPDDEDSLSYLHCVNDEGIKEYSPNRSTSDISGEDTLNFELNPFSLKSIERNEKTQRYPHCFKFPPKLKRHITIDKIKQNNTEVDGRGKTIEPISAIEKSLSLKSEALDLPKRMRPKKNNVRCPKCLNSFKYPSKLLRHIKTHVGLKSYNCNLCSKTFLEKFNLTAHKIRTHGNEQLYICEICARPFNVKSNLSRRMRSHMREEQFTCNKCGKSCNSEKKLAIHFRAHDKIPHTCPQCGKVFKKKSNLSRHVKIHFNERGYPCKLCDFRAGQHSHLERHMQRKHVK